MNKIVKRGILLAVLLVCISGLTIYFTIDMQSLSSLETFNGRSLIAALVALAVRMYFDGLRLQRLVGMGGYKLPIRAVLRVIFGNYFMAMLTPGASGGAVAQVLILKSYGVPIFKGAPIVLVRTVFSILFLIVMLPVIFAFERIPIPYISSRMLLELSLLMVVCTIVGLYLLRTRLLKILVYRVIKLRKNGNPKVWLIRLNELNDGFSLIYARPFQSMLVDRKSVV